MTTHTIADLQRAGNDNRVFFKRPDESIYAVIDLKQMRHLKRLKMLDDYLQEQRDSGIVIRIAGA